MTEVSIHIDSELRWDISIKGHADYSKGPDIVCSACSTLACTLLQAMRKMEAEGWLYEYHDGTESGNVKLIFSVRDREPALTKASTIIETVTDGYRMLAERYPDNVTVKWICDAEL